MTENVFNRYVRCSFISNENIVSATPLPVAEVYLLSAADLENDFRLPEHLVSPEDRARTNRLQNEMYRNLILSGYTLLRSVLADKIGCSPDLLSFEKESAGKPLIKNNPLFFNLAHTRKSFAFVVSNDFRNGIDLEEMNRRINFEPIIQRFFSVDEADYIRKGREKSIERFILLWTRKESVLKLIGTGLTDDLTSIDVYKRVNRIDRRNYASLRELHVPDHTFIYSGKFGDLYLSVALPCRAEINFRRATTDLLKTGR
jgi:4'-phosphopantetheinyl transferase